MSLSFNVRPSESGRNAGLAMNGAVRFLETLSRFSVSRVSCTLSLCTPGLISGSVTSDGVCVMLCYLSIKPSGICTSNRMRVINYQPPIRRIVSRSRNRHEILFLFIVLRRTCSMLLQFKDPLRAFSTQI